MRLLLGVILGIVLTVLGAYAYDSTTGRAPNGLTPSAANGRPPMVNWDVVNDNLNDVKSHLRDAGAEIERGWKRLTG